MPRRRLKSKCYRDLIGARARQQKKQRTLTREKELTKKLQNAPKMHGVWAEEKTEKMSEPQKPCMKSKCMWCLFCLNPQLNLPCVRRRCVNVESVKKKPQPSQQQQQQQCALFPDSQNPTSPQECPEIGNIEKTRKITPAHLKRHRIPKTMTQDANFTGPVESEAGESKSPDQPGKDQSVPETQTHDPDTGFDSIHTDSDEKIIFVNEPEKHQSVAETQTQDPNVTLDVYEVGKFSDRISPAQPEKRQTVAETETETQDISEVIHDRDFKITVYINDAGMSDEDNQSSNCDNYQISAYWNEIDPFYEQQAVPDYSVDLYRSKPRSVHLPYRGVSFLKKDRLYVCEICDHMFPTRRRLTQHKESSHPEVTPQPEPAGETRTGVAAKRRPYAPYPCPHCETMFRTIQSRKMHIPSHFGANPCNQCRQPDIDSEGALIRHINERHDGGANPYFITCLFCNAVFAVRTPGKGNDFASHCKETHPYKTYAQPRCMLCGRWFTYRSILNVHIETHHREFVSDMLRPIARGGPAVYAGGERNRIRCPTCPFSFVTMYAFNKHLTLKLDPIRSSQQDHPYTTAPSNDDLHQSQNTNVKTQVRKRPPVSVSGSSSAMGAVANVPSVGVGDKVTDPEPPVRYKCFHCRRTQMDRNDFLHHFCTKVYSCSYCHHNTNIWETHRTHLISHVAVAPQLLTNPAGMSLDL